MAKKKTKKRKHSPKGLSGVKMTKEAGKHILKEGSKPLLIVAGLWAGNMAGKGIDKLFPDAAKPDKFHLKALIKPAAQIGVGGAIIFFGRKKDYIKSFGYGFTGSGIITGVKLLKKDLFAGLGETGEIASAPVEAKYYREAKDEIMKLLQDNSFRPALPESTNNATPISAIDLTTDTEMSGLNVDNSGVL